MTKFRRPVRVLVARPVAKTFEMETMHKVPNSG